MPNKPRWTEEALADYASIVRVVKREQDRAAARIADRIQSATETISAMPFAGRTGESAGTRELVLGGLPYIIVYRVEHGEPGFDLAPRVVILRIRHGAMQWPPDDAP